MDDTEIDMYTRVYAKEFQYYFPFPIYDKDGNVIKEAPETEDKDYNFVRTTIDDMFNNYSYRYKDKKDRMFHDMTQRAKMTEDLNLRSLTAHCAIFPRILNDFHEILLKELKEREKNKI